MSKIHILKSIGLGIIGTIPFWLTILLGEVPINEIIEPLLFFCGVGVYFGYLLFKKDTSLTSKEQRNIHIIAVIIAIITCIAGECILSYRTLLRQYADIGVYNYNYTNIMQDVPLHHLLGYYIGIDALNTAEVDSKLMGYTMVQMWQHLIFSVIFSWAGISLPIHIKRLIAKKDLTKSRKL